MSDSKNFGLRNLESLFFVYILLAAAVFFLSDIFFSDILQHGNLPSIIQITVFMAAPAAVLVIIVIYSLQFFRELRLNKIGARLRFRLNSYFLTVIVLVALPFAAVLTLSLSKIINYLDSWEIGATLEEAESLALENYSLHVNEIVKNIDEKAEIGGDLLAVELFTENDGNWSAGSFQGNEKFRLPSPPIMQTGVMSREVKRDRDVIRFVDADNPRAAKVYTFSLGDGFDSTVERIRVGRLKLEAFENMVAYYPFFIALYLVMIFVPLIIVGLMIGIYFADRISLPVIELNRATKKVSEGDYSVQIYSRDKDELGALVSSFNSMVMSLEHSKAALVRAENMSIWQNMARQLAHEIKNPLTPVRLSAERVLRNYRNNPERLPEILESSMNVIIKEVETLTGLLDEFRTLSRPVELKTSIVRFNDTLLDCVSIFSTTYPGIHFETAGVEEGLWVAIGEQHLRQIVNNIIINAIDAMERNGRVDISAVPQIHGDTAFVKISISDTGSGISEEAKDKVFTPYWTSKSDGTGLGLPIVERIVRDYGGDIDFYSAPGVGTTFVIRLPAGENPEAAA